MQSNLFNFSTSLNFRVESFKSKFLEFLNQVRDIFWRINFHEDTLVKISTQNSKESRRKMKIKHLATFFYKFLTKFSH
jgi:hypothetical protein